VLITGLKPADDGRAVIVRLFGASGKSEALKLDWGTWKPKAVLTTNTGEQPGAKAGNRVTVPGYGLVSLRAEMD
jgi:alpha-mannosidase